MDLQYTMIQKLHQIIGQTGIPIDEAHNRIAIDYRYDGIIGFWNESAVIRSEKTQIILSTFGADYTLPILNGLLIMVETMYASNKNNEKMKQKIILHSWQVYL